jgi:hypothetical protein
MLLSKFSLAIFSYYLLYFFAFSISLYRYDKIDIEKFDKNINDIDWNDKIGNFDDVDDM